VREAAKDNGEPTIRASTIPDLRHQESILMRSTPGLGLLVIAIVASAEIMTQVTGMYSHWLFVIPGIIVGLWAVRSIR